MPQYIIKKNTDNNEKIVYLVEEKSGKNIALSSQKSARKEAQRILDNNHDGQPTMINILGAGNHYLIELALKRFSVPIVVITADKELTELVQPLIQRESIKKNDSRLFFFYGQSEEKLMEKIKEFFHTHKNVGRKILFLKNQREARLNEDFFEKAKEKIISQQNEKSINRSTFKRFEKIWQKNIVKNMTKCVESLPIHALRGLGEAHHAIAIGAGPSLKMDLEYLKKKQNQFFIIAVDTVVKPLLLNDIFPDAIVSVDPQKINSRYLENLTDPCYKRGKEVYENTLLVADPAVCEHSLRHFQHLAMFDTFSPFYKFICAFFGNKGQIDSGGSVISTAYELARSMNFSTLILCGVDLSFFLDSYHLNGSMYEQYWLENTNRFSTFEMKMSKLVNQETLTKEKNVANQNVFSDSPMKLYRAWLETRESNQDFLFCANASQTGVKIKKMEHMPLEKACEKAEKIIFQQEKKSGDKKKLLEKIKTLTQKHKNAVQVDENNRESINKWAFFWKNIKEIRLLLQKGGEKLEHNLEKSLKLFQKKKKEKEFWMAVETLKKNTEKMTQHIIVRDFISAVMQETIYNVEEKNPSPVDEKNMDYFFDFYKKILQAIQLNIKIIDRFLLKQEKPLKPCSLEKENRLL